MVEGMLFLQVSFGSEPYDNSVVWRLVWLVHNWLLKELMGSIRPAC